MLVKPNAPNFYPPPGVLSRPFPAPSIVRSPKLWFPQRRGLLVPVSAAVSVDNVQSNQGGATTTVSVVDYAVGGSVDVLVAVGGFSDGSGTTLSCDFGVTAMTEVITRVDDRGDGTNHRCSIFELTTASGTETVTLTASATVDELKLVVFGFVDVLSQAAEATGTAGDSSGPFTISIGSGVSANAGVVYGGYMSTANESITDVTFSGMTGLAEVIDAGGLDAMGVGWEDAGAGGSATGDMDHNDTGSEWCTLVAASYEPDTGGGGQNVPEKWNHYRQMKN